MLSERKPWGSGFVLLHQNSRVDTGHIFSCPTFPQRNMLMVQGNVSILYFYPLKMLGNDKAVAQPYILILIFQRVRIPD
jgi:hypothetical protein